MDMIDFINQEYKAFCTGRLYFEVMFVDSLEYLVGKGYIQVKREDVVQAFAEVRAYRIELLRKFFLNQDAVRETRIIPVTMEQKQREERKIRKQLTKQLLIFKWYQQQKEKGVENIFLELSPVQ